MKNLFYYSAIFAIFISCSNKSEDKVEEEINYENAIAESVTPFIEVSAQDLVRAGGVPFSVVDPYWGKKTNRIPLYKTDINFTMNNDGTLSGNRIRVQYGWSPKGYIMDSVVFNDEFKGKWIQRDRLISGREPVYQITLEDWGYEWYLPAHGKHIYAKP